MLRRECVLFVRHEVYNECSRSRQGIFRPFTGFLDPPEIVAVSIAVPHTNEIAVGPRVSEGQRNMQNESGDVPKQRCRALHYPFSSNLCLLTVASTFPNRILGYICDIAVEQDSQNLAVLKIGSLCLSNHGYPSKCRFSQ